MVKIKSFIRRVLNFFVLKHKNRIYVKERLPYPKTNCDLLNYGASNMYTFLYNYLLRIKPSRKVVFYIDYSNPKRLAEYEKYRQEVEKNDKVRLIFVKRYGIGVSKIKNKWNKLWSDLRRFSCKTWLCESGDNFFKEEKLHCQNIICFNYFIPCKNDLIVGDNWRWSYLKGYITTSLLAGQIVSASMGVKLDNSIICGFPRNDTLVKQEKKEKVFDWIKKKVGFIPKRIFLYAPTYRDYEFQNQTANCFTTNQIEDESNKIISQRTLLGYEADDLVDFLEKNKIVLIYHLHHLQRTDCLKENSSMIAYEENYDFTLYDLMAVTDCLISDYSSISYDFLLLNKPIIFNLYDLEKYIRCRGVSYEPFDEFCPGAIVRNWEEMKQAITDVLAGKDDYKDKRERICRLLHKYPDGNSTERVIAYFDDYLKNLLEGRRGNKGGGK